MRRAPHSSALPAAPAAGEARTAAEHKRQLWGVPQMAHQKTVARHSTVALSQCTLSSPVGAWLGGREGTAAVSG